MSSILLVGLTNIESGHTNWMAVMIGLNISWWVTSELTNMVRICLSLMSALRDKEGRFFSSAFASASGVDGGGGTSTGETARAQ